MTEKQLISQLHNLKDVNPGSQWTQENRDLLLSQISDNNVNSYSFRIFMRAISRPAFALGLFVIILITGSIFSHHLFINTKPNNSLYIARIISEKAKLNTIFDKQEREKMEVKFANDHAKDIASALNTTKDEKEVARLTQDFKGEMSIVKKKIKHVSSVKKEVKKEEVKKEEVSGGEVSVIMAETGKDDKGLELDKKDEVEEVASNTEEEKKEEIKEEDNTDQIIEDIEKSFDNKDYDQVIDQLKKVEELVKD